MSAVIQNLASFVGLMLMALFVENAVFTRGLGVSRLVNLVTNSSVDGVIFCSLLTLVLVISAPLGFFANQFIMQQQFWFRDYIRPLILVVCAIIAFFIVLFGIFLVRPANTKNIVAVLPMATFNGAVLGPMLVTATQNYTFVQTMGFALGSGLGYGLAVLIVSEGQRRMNNRSVPATFKGLPINLLYIGILALAIYALTGHRVAI
ncbi:NADH:ubiquinone oxidoreductase, subunit RnfA [Ruminococcaceae bacterium OttesenSCG-928-A16]|nr:NADH:ubiquinone oxidoreductase, subunit RnfA [Ruminococcaceae bacterium OttesenSCG-928-A16]